MNNDEVSQNSRFPKSENLKKENTATVINAIEDSPIQKTTKKEKNWFQKFLEEVFGVN